MGSLALYCVMTYRRDKERVGRFAARQQGRVTLDQLKRLGVSTSTVQGWRAQGYLTHLLPGVYAVGHTAPSWEAELWTAVLYAGPGAMLSHRTAARWRAVIEHAPQVIEVSTPRRVRSLRDIRVYARRAGLVRELHRSMPVTTIPVMMVDLAAISGTRVVQRALGQLDFQKLLDTDALLAACGSGRRGAIALRKAIDEYDPRRKYANGDLELDFYDLCKRRRLPLPLLNTYVHEIKCDAYWPGQRFVAELDSELAHASAAQRRRDRRNDLILRSHGLTVVRYDWDLVHEQPEEVCADVLRQLERRLVAARRGLEADRDQAM